MYDFDKAFLLAFYNSFLKIKLSFDKENMLILNTCRLQKKMLSNWTCVDLQIDKMCSWEMGLKNS